MKTKTLFPLIVVMLFALAVTACGGGAMEAPELESTAGEPIAQPPIYATAPPESRSDEPIATSGDDGNVAIEAPAEEEYVEEAEEAPIAEGDSASEVSIEVEAEVPAEEEVAGGSADEPIAIAPEPLPTLAVEQPPEDNYFEDYGVNPFQDTYEDNLSTFALDVDTGAYSVMRRYLEDGWLPPADSVRVEEYVNYFDQGYQAPRNSNFAVYADAAPSPFPTDDAILMRVGVQGYEILESERPPVNLTFVIDVSGSMDRENRLGLVKRSLELLVDRLNSDDTVAIVVFGNNARVLLDPTPVRNRGAILDAIFELQPEGSTNAEAGLQVGYQTANRAYTSNATNRVILLSDGVANVGATTADAILESVRRYADAGITLTTVGVGMGNFNDVLMEQLADNGQGHYAYIDDLDEAQRLFVDDMTSTLITIAYDAKVQVEFNPDVVSRYRLIGYENRDVADEDFRNNAVDAGELGAGHTATAIYALHLWPGANGRIATVHLRWEDPDSRRVTEIAGDFNTWNMDASFDEADAHYQQSVIVMQFAEILRESPYARGTTLDMLSAMAERVAGRVGSEDAAEFAYLVNLARALEP